jgi:hypothetical protein
MTCKLEANSIAWTYEGVGLGLVSYMVASELIPSIAPAHSKEKQIIAGGHGTLEQLAAPAHDVCNSSTEVAHNNVVVLGVTNDELGDVVIISAFDTAAFVTAAVVMAVFVAPVVVAALVVGSIAAVVTGVLPGDGPKRAQSTFSAQSQYWPLCSNPSGQVKVEVRTPP